MVKAWAKCLCWKLERLKRDSEKEKKHSQQKNSMKMTLLPLMQQEAVVLIISAMVFHNGGLSHRSSEKCLDTI